MPCLFKGKKVFAEAGSDGELLGRHGRVAIVYRLGASKSYSTFADRLAPMPGATVVEGAPPPAAAEGARSRSGSTSGGKSGGGKGSGQGRRDSSILGGGEADLTDPEAVHMWTDGACSGNPGPGGAGTIVLFPGRRLDIATWLGSSTNNIAELTAILVGLEQLPAGDPRTIVVHTDSQYCIGVLAKRWKAKSNVELIHRVKALLARHDRVVWHWVRGHEGVVLNEAADALARSAVYNEADSRNESESEA
jgi:ribonuclease HI